MNLTLELPDEKIAAWKSQAEAQGLTVEAWIQSVAEEHIKETSHAAPDLPIWEVIAGRMAALHPDAFENQPRDGASEHDHYLYGHPKRDL